MGKKIKLLTLNCWGLPVIFFLKKIFKFYRILLLNYGNQNQIKQKE